MNESRYMDETTRRLSHDVTIVWLIQWNRGARRVPICFWSNSTEELSVSGDSTESNPKDQVETLAR